MTTHNNSVQAVATLKSVMQKQGFQLANLVHQVLGGEVVLSDDSINEVLHTIADDHKVINNIEFLVNLSNNEELFNKLLVNTKEGLNTREGEDGKGFELRAITKVISTFKGLNKLKEVITLGDYAQFIGEALGQAKPVDPVDPVDPVEATS